MKRNSKQAAQPKSVHEKEYIIQGLAFKWAKPCFNYRERAEKLRLNYTNIINDAIKPLKKEALALGIEDDITRIAALSSDLKKSSDALNVLKKKYNKDKKNKGLRREINSYKSELSEANQLLLGIVKLKSPEFKEYNYIFKKMLEVENAHRSIFVASHAKEIIETCLDIEGKKIDYKVTGDDFLALEKIVQEIFSDFFLSFQS